MPDPKLIVLFPKKRAVTDKIGFVIAACSNDVAHIARDGVDIQGLVAGHKLLKAKVLMAGRMFSPRLPEEPPSYAADFFDAP